MATNPTLIAQDPLSKLKNNGVDFTSESHTDTYEFISPKQFDLQNRAVFVSGASKGIGRVTAISYAIAGASFIAIGARSSFKGLGEECVAAAKAAGRKESPKVLELVLDVTSKQSVKDAAERIAREFGRLDIVVNNSGAMEDPAPVADSDPDQWWATWEVNVKGPYLVSRALLPLLIQTSNGLKTILNVSSIGAHGLRPEASAYQPSKLALLRFTEIMNSEYKSDGLLSFSIHPGGVLTELAAKQEAIRPLLVDSPHLAADAVVWLTAERREWLKSRYVSVKWDMKELLEKRAKIEKEDLLRVRMAVGTDW